MRSMTCPAGEMQSRGVVYRLETTDLRLGLRLALAGLPAGRRLGGELLAAGSVPGSAGCRHRGRELAAAH